MLGDVVREAARRFGDTPAIVTEEGHTLSYAELDRLSDEVAAGMEQRGVRRGSGDVVGLLMDSGPGYVVAYVAAAKIGAVTAGVNERLSPPEKVACLNVAQPSLVIAEDEEAADLAAQVLPPSSETEVVVAASCYPTNSLLTDIRVDGATSEPLDDDPDRPVAIVFTSGTTGLPKGAVFCDRQLDAISEADGGKRFGAGGRGLGSTSMAHLGTMTKLPQTLRGGGTTFLMKKWSAGAALQMVERHGITALGGIPTRFALMLRHERFETTDVSSVKLIILGGGPSAPALVREVREKFGIPVIVRYSCTEAGVGTGTLPGDPPEDAEETVGRPRPGVEVTIRGFAAKEAPGGRPDDVELPAGELERPAGEIELPAGEIGEVCLRSEAVMAGYFRDPEATKAALTTDGAVRTGDLGYVDEQGRLHLCGRAKEMYVRGGYNVFPLEVEAVLCEHPSIAHVAVAPRPDPVMGEIGVAVVVLRDGASPPLLEDLRKHAEGRLARHKMPEALLVMDELPLTAMEKVDRRALCRQLSATEAI